jgi:hypothetical protein
MNAHVRHLLGQIGTLEARLRTAVRDQEGHQASEPLAPAPQQHRGLWHWALANRPQNLLTGPVIYGMVVPLVLLDLFVSFYQATCFPVYRIAKVRRGDYFVFDRKELGYLNPIQRFHCAYCTYSNGLLAYASEIVARTEAYFCPIKHAKKVLAPHARYADFLEYGDATDYEARLEQVRKRLEPESPPQAGPAR